MKVKQKDFQFIKDTIREKVVKKHSLAEIRKNYINNKIGKNPEIRFLWDTLYVCKIRKFICETLYKYCNDTHITTATRKAVKELIKE